MITCNGDATWEMEFHKSMSIHQMKQDDNRKKNYPVRLEENSENNSCFLDKGKRVLLAPM